MTQPSKYRIKPRQATLARYKDGSPTIKIEFPFSPEDVALVKTLPGRKYNPDHRIWTCPPTKHAVKMLKEWAFVIDKKLLDFMRKADPPPVLEIPGLKKKLFPFQKSGVAFLQNKDGRGLVGDEQGLGKTIQALAWLQLNKNKRPVIIVVPASVKMNWLKEIRAWMSDVSVEVLQGKSPYSFKADIIIINYNILNGWLNTLIELQPKVIIADEIQYVKNSKAKRTKALRKLSRFTKNFIALSGTPIVNRPVEFYNAIQMINPELFPNWQNYVRRYCAARNNGFGLDVSGASNTDELHEILTDSIMIRRTKQEVLTDLPDKIHSFFPLEMHPEMVIEYEEAEDNFIEWVQRKKGKAAADRVAGAEALTEIEILKQIAVTAKLPAAIDWIKDFLDTGEKLVVFATHRFVIDRLMKDFGKVGVKIDGSVSGGERQVAVEKFQNEPETRLFVGNIKAAGVGITLTAASNVAFLELPWEPGSLSQAEDRCHRIGQKDTVNVYYLLAEYTIEEKIAQLLDSKRKVLDSVLDGVESADEGMIMTLIEDYEEA